MNKFYEDLRSTERLPSPPGIVVELLRLTQSPETSAGDIARVVRPDPALTGRILQMANSAAASGDRAVTTVDEAAVRLGIRTISTIALGFSVVSEHRTGRCENFPYDRFWSRSLARAVVLQTLSHTLRCGDPSEMFVAGLLGSIGQLALATAHPRRYAALLGTEELLAAEQSEFGIDQHEVARCLLADWGLPDRFLEILAGLHGDATPDGKPGPQRLAGAGAEAAEALLDPAARARQEEIEAMLAQFQRWDAGQLESVWDESIREWHRWGSAMQIPTQSLPPATAPATDPQTPCVLAVDDDPPSLKMLEVQLRGEGFEVLTATNGREALRIAVESTPDIVVADWMMPDMDGVELCKALRTFEAGQRTYVVLVSGQDQEERMVEAFEAGVDDYVTKPYRPRLLMARIKAGLRVLSLQKKIESAQVTMQSQVAELGILTRNLEVVSLTDALTSLPNRRHGMQTLSRLWDRSTERGTEVAAVMIDIDHFKRCNDDYGHDVGDAVLVEVAQALQASTRGTDLLFRYGGEEFCVLLDGGDVEAARRCGERVRAAVAAHRIEAGNFSGTVTVSVGVAARDPSMDRSEDLLKTADEALYRAKETGRDRVCVAGEPLAV